MVHWNRRCITSCYREKGLKTLGSLSGSRDVIDYVTIRFAIGHWLKVPERIQFQLGVLAYRCLHNTVQAYLTESLQLVRDVDAQGNLCSADSMTLVVPATRCSTLGDRAFSVSAAQTWNVLLSAVTQSCIRASSLASFRQKLRHTLFVESFPDT